MAQLVVTAGLMIAGNAAGGAAAAALGYGAIGTGLLQGLGAATGGLLAGALGPTIRHGGPRLEALTATITHRGVRQGESR